MVGRGPCARILLVLALLGMVVGCRSTPADATPTPAGTATPVPFSVPGPTVQPKDRPLVTPVTTRIATPSPETTGALPCEGVTIPMALTVLFDNNPYDPRLQTGWGFAAWIEYGERIVLFDTGADGAVLLDNMAALGLDPRAIDMVVLSHDHGDHTGGLAGLLAVNSQTCADRGECISVYLPQAFPSRFKEQLRPIGASVVEVTGPTEILPGLWSTGQMGTDIVEQALVARTEKGLVVVTGCAHPGIDKMVARAGEIGRCAIALIVGGFHLGGASRARVEEIIGEFRWLGVQQVAPSHCTGDQARDFFRKAYGSDFYPCGVGWRWAGQAVPWNPSGQGIPAQVGVAAIAVAPGDPHVIYLAAYEPGGLYRSADGGNSWRAASVGLETLAPLAIAVDPGDADVVWAGTMVGGYRTSDGGRSWQPMADLPSVPVYALAVKPDGRNLYAGGEEMGIWRSDDAGRSWRVSQAVGGPATVLSLAVAPDGMVLAGTAGQGVWRSRDGGQQWQSNGEDLAQSYISLVVAMDDGRSYALADGSLYLSHNGGQGWHKIGPSDFKALSFATEPGPAGRLYLGSRGEGVAMSPDGGRSWEWLGSELHHADVTCLEPNPAAPDRVFLGTRNNGLYRSDDAGASWTLASGKIGQPVIAALAQDPANPQVFYAGALDGVYRSDDGGERWRLVSGDMGLLFVQSLAVDPTAKRIYVGTDSGIYVSQDGGATWRWAKDDTGGIAIFDIRLDPHDANRIYAGSWGHNVLRSADGGQTWAPIHHGLETLSVHAFAVDPSDPQVLYAGTVETLLRSTDRGQTWQIRPVAGRPLTILALAIDAGDSARLYAGTTEGVYLSVDGGQAWQPAGHDSLDATVTALALDPDDSGTILAGTEHHGLYRSTDGGVHWQRGGMAGASVYAILMDRVGTIWLGTDRGIFRDR